MALQRPDVGGVRSRAGPFQACRPPGAAIGRAVRLEAAKIPGGQGAEASAARRWFSPALGRAPFAGIKPLLNARFLRRAIAIEHGEAASAPGQLIRALAVGDHPASNGLGGRPQLQ